MRKNSSNKPSSNRFQKNINLVFKVTEDELLKKQPRNEWELEFKSNKKRLKNRSLLSKFQNEFDKEEWEW